MILCVFVTSQSIFVLDGYNREKKKEAGCICIQMIYWDRLVNVRHFEYFFSQ